MGYRYALTNFPACFIYVFGLNDQQSGYLATCELQDDDINLSKSVKE
jgi:hypothetical protein